MVNSIKSLSITRGYNIYISHNKSWSVTLKHHKFTNDKITNNNVINNILI